MCDEYTDDATDKVIKLTEEEYNAIWFDMQWPEDKERLKELKNQYCGVVKWVKI